MSEQQALRFDEDGLDVDVEPDAADDPELDAAVDIEPDGTVDVGLPPLEVRIVRSARRKKTVGAHLVDGVLEIIVPRWMSNKDAQSYADEFRVRFERKRKRTDIDLLARSRSLAKSHGFLLPTSVRWVANQNTRWGSCTPSDGSIRISDRLRSAPLWVLDSVLAHELAHLRHADHSPAFWAEANRYPETQRARGFLEGWTHPRPWTDDASTNDTPTNETPTSETSTNDTPT